MAEADVIDVFRNVSTALHQAQNVWYVVHDVLFSEFRLAFIWTASPVYRGLMAAAVVHAHCNT